MYNSQGTRNYTINNCIWMYSVWKKTTGNLGTIHHTTTTNTENNLRVSYSILRNKGNKIVAVQCKTKTDKPNQYKIHWFFVKNIQYEEGRTMNVAAVITTTFKKKLEWSGYSKNSNNLDRWVIYSNTFYIFYLQQVTLNILDMDVRKRKLFIPESTLILG